MTNARCLTEGVDVPAIDCVLFADPKQSRIDIVQAAGRALRRYPGKDYGYILLPLIVPSKMEFSKFAETTAFWQVASTITALSTQDERIAEEFRAIEKGRIPSGKIVEIEGDVPLGMKIKLGDFAETISTRLWESVGRANWRKFEDARTFTHDLKLHSVAEWFDYCQSGKKPVDIPTSPPGVYSAAGWSNWGDWLGSATVATNLRQFRSFKKARVFARSLGLTKKDEWVDYCASLKKPKDVPSSPKHQYAEAGWSSWADWLGAGRHRGNGWRSFTKARLFVRRLQLRSNNEWRAYLNSNKKPHDIPANPHQVYADKGWSGWGDWLGTGRHWDAAGWRPFKKARAFVHRLGLKSYTEWREYLKSDKKPDDIPASPVDVYAKSGWAGWGDWLGSGTIATTSHQFRPFKIARAFVRRLGLKNNKDWREYYKSANRPDDIPSNPERTYAKDGWAGFGDWVGSGNIANSRRKFRSFNNAREFVHRLGLKSSDKWSEYCKSGKKPNDIPAHPDRIFADAGWAGYGDWLGY